MFTNEDTEDYMESHCSGLFWSTILSLTYRTKSNQNLSQLYPKYEPHVPAHTELWTHVAKNLYIHIKTSRFTVV